MIPLDNKVYILSAARTPVGSLNGAFSSLKAHELGSQVIRETIKRASLSPENVSEVILGQALTAGQGQNPARQAALGSGLPYTTPAYSINMLCGSGLKSVALGCQSILSGSSVVVCGGQESMSQAPHACNLRVGTKMGTAKFLDTMLHDGLTDAFNDIHMGVTAENMAKQWKISREDQDKFAVDSQTKADVAISNGYFKSEIIPVFVPKQKVTVEEDEHPRRNCSIEALSKLKPCFVLDGSGTVTAGNSSGINDGAAAVLLASESVVKNKLLKPLAVVLSCAEAGVEPSIMGYGPVPAVKNALSKCNWSIDEVDLWELNEAFAAQSIVVIKELGLNLDKVNVSGGAIALGHPIGASGARVLVTLIYNMKRLGKKKGVASLCIGGGMGIAICVELCD